MELPKLEESASSTQFVVDEEGQKPFVDTTVDVLRGLAIFLMFTVGVLAFVFLMKGKFSWKCEIWSS